MSRGAGRFEGGESYKVKVVYTVGDSRTGSSLLQHLLSLQGTIVALGEVRRLERLVREGESCACGFRIEKCEFWRGIAGRIGLSLGELRTIPSNNVLRRRFSQAIGWAAIRFGLEGCGRKVLVHERRAIDNCLAIYRAASEMTGNEVVLDASKVPSHFLLLYLARKELMRPVFLVRDGRGVVWSKMERTGISAAGAARQWLNVSKMLLAIRKVVPDSSSVLIRYEDLCNKPQDVLERVLKLVNVPFRSADPSSIRMKLLLSSSPGSLPD